MKIQSVISLIIISGMALSLPALGGDGKYSNGKSRFMSFFDTNGDNIVTMEEFNTAAAARFNRIDADSNGVISKDEFHAYMGKKRQERNAQRFQMMDSDADGQVSQQEYLTYKQQKAERRFKSMDLNNDGVVSQEEYEARKSRWSGRKHGHRGKGGIFAKLDANGDGQITRDESLAAWTSWFKRIDANGDQIVTAEEVRDYRNNKMKSWK